MKVGTISSCFFLVLFFCAQVMFYQHSYIKRLEQEIRLAQQAKNIDNDNIRDILHELSQVKMESEATSSRQFVAGVIEAITKPERYSEIWHSGYDRGVSVQQYADQIGVKTYTEKKDK